MAKIIVIPARLASERFPEKLLQDDTGWPLIRHVYDRCTLVPDVDRVVVAVDGPRLEDAVQGFGGDAVRTAPELPSGTDRVAEALANLGIEGDHHVVNVQGDEPEIDPDHVALLFRLLEEAAGAGERRRPAVTTLATPRTDREGFLNPHRVKVVVDRHGDALYFSRAPIPHGSDPAAHDDDGHASEWLHHVGIYGFLPSALAAFRDAEPGPLERRERLEQLRFLELGLAIRVGRVEGAAPGIDTVEDYRGFVARARQRAASGNEGE